MTPILSQGMDTEIQNILDELHILLEDYIENTEGAADLDFNTLTEDLLQLYNTKIDINKAQASDLSTLFFLSNNDIQQIINYRSSYGSFLSIYEIQAVPDILSSKARMIIPFIKVVNERIPANPYKITSLQSAKNDIYLKLRRTLETRKGFVREDNQPPAYAGDANYLYLRYAHTGLNRQKWGLIIEKDAGEPLLSRSSPTGVDYLSAYFEQKNISPLVEQFNIGDYTVSMGQGLVTHSSFGVGKSSFTTAVSKGGAQIRHFSSVVENQALRGVSTILRPHPRWRIMVLASYDRRDANLINPNDPEKPIAVSSIQTSGLHRTASEREDFDAIGELTYGSHIGWSNNKLNIGLNNINHHFDKPLERNAAPYRLYQWQGQSLSNYSIDYRWMVGGWNLYGELAHSSNGGWAAIQGAIKSLDRMMDIAFVYRNYGKAYQALWPNSFGESLNANNENGIYMGIHMKPSNKWTLKAYIDLWRNPWLTSRVDGMGMGQEYLLRAEYKHNKQHLYYLLYRYEQKSENSSLPSEIDIPVPKRTQRLRGHMEHKLPNAITLRSRVEWSWFRKDMNNTQGFMIYQDLLLAPMAKPFSIACRLAYFDTDDFNTRIYAYENDILYEYFIPAYSGHGLRYYLKINYKVNKSLLLEARMDQTRYFDRTIISSGNQSINSEQISGIKMQARLSF